MSKKKKGLIFCTVLATLLFIGVYVGYLKHNETVKYKNDLYKDSNSVMSKSRLQNTIKYNTKLIFKTVYLKSKEIKDEELIVENYDKELIGYNREKVQSYFLKKGFKLEKMDSKEVILTKNVDRYSPNKYIIGIKETKQGEFMAIFRTDNEGKMYIEDEKDITNVKINILRKEEIKMLKEGCLEFQFDTKDKAKEAVTEYQS